MPIIEPMLGGIFIGICLSFLFSLIFDGMKTRSRRDEEEFRREVRNIAKQEFKWLWIENSALLRIELKKEMAKVNIKPIDP